MATKVNSRYEVIQKVKTSLIKKQSLAASSNCKTKRTVSPKKDNSVKLSTGLNNQPVPSELDNNLSRSNSDTDNGIPDGIRRSRRKRKINFDKFTDYETTLSDLDCNPGTRTERASSSTRRKKTCHNDDVGSNEDKTQDGQVYNNNNHKYRQFRDRNNESSRKSRLNRKLREIELHKEAILLESRNIKLISEVNRIENLIDKFNMLLIKVFRHKSFPVNVCINGNTKLQFKMCDDENESSSNLDSISPKRVKLNNFTSSEQSFIDSKQNMQLQNKPRSCSEDGSADGVNMNNLDLVPRNSVMTFVRDSVEQNKINKFPRSGDKESKNESSQLVVEIETDSEDSYSQITNEKQVAVDADNRFSQITNENQVANIIKAMKTEEVFGIARNRTSIDYEKARKSSSHKNDKIKDCRLQESPRRQEDDEAKEVKRESDSCDTDSNKANRKYGKIVGINQVCRDNKSKESHKKNGKINFSNNLANSKLKSFVKDSAVTIYDASQVVRVETISDDEDGSNDEVFDVESEHDSENGTEKLLGNQAKTILLDDSDKSQKKKNVRENGCDIESFQIFHRKNNSPVEKKVVSMSRNQSSIVSKARPGFNKNVATSKDISSKQNQCNSNVKMISILKRNTNESQTIYISSGDESSSSLVIASDFNDDTSDSSSLEATVITNKKNVSEQNLTINRDTDDLIVKENILRQQKEYLLSRVQEVEGYYVNNFTENSTVLNVSPQHTNYETSDSTDFVNCYDAKFEFIRQRNNIASKKCRYRRRLSIVDIEMQCLILEKENQELKEKAKRLEKLIEKLHFALLSFVNE